MTAANVTIADLNEALFKVNRNFKSNIVWNREPEPIGKRLRFTLTVIHSGSPGGRRSAFMARKAHAGYGPKPRRVHAACWHVHGQFFHFLYQRAPTAIIKSHGRTITGPDKAHGNWYDWNAGSIACPMMASQTCECGRSAE